MPERRAARAGLKLIAGGGTDASVGRVLVCGRCGAADAPGRHGLCSACRVGVLIETDAADAPGDEPFIVVEPSLRILAVSERAEQVLGVYEQDASGRPVTRYLIPAGAHRQTGFNYAMAIYDALGAGITQSAWARLARHPAILVRLRISACVSPKAALLVFESGPA